MSPFFGMDYDRGLLMLKEYVEEGKVNSKLEIQGINHYEGSQFVGLKTSCEISKMKEHMSADWEKIMTYFMQKHPDLIAGAPFSQYHKWSPVKDRVEYTAAMPVHSIPEELLDGTFVGSMPSVKVHSIKHTGPYHHSGNVWSAQYTRQRAKIFKVNKKVDPFEVYLNSPTNTPPNELETIVHFPIKG